MEIVWEVLEQTKDGEKMTEKDFDLKLYKTAQLILEDYDIKYDKFNTISTDDKMIDQVFEAGMRLYEEMGTLCLDTGRLIKFSENEIKEILNATPSKVAAGCGNERKVLSHRDVEGKQEPIVWAGIQTLVFSDEDTMFKIYKGCCGDESVDGIWGGIIENENKPKIYAGKPSEIYAYRRSAEIMRAAAEAAGRPGVCLVNNAPTSKATIAMYDEDVALRKTDAFETDGTTELKLTLDDLDRTTWGLINGKTAIHGIHGSIIGGFSGTIEGAALVMVANALQLVMVNRANILRSGAVPLRVKGRGVPEHIWAAGTAVQALSRNTSLILDGSFGDHPAAGPGTKQYFYESGLGHIASVVCGGHNLSGTRKFITGQSKNFGSPLESRWMGEVSKASVNLSRKEANVLVNKLFSLYDLTFKDVPEGYVFKELYDVEEMVPKAFYQKIYEEIKEEFSGYGFKWGKWR